MRARGWSAARARHGWRSRPGRRARRAGGGALACALIACLCATVAGAAPRVKRHHPPARLLVYAQEWSLWPSQVTLPHGAVVVQLWNRGQDAHDLRIRRLNRRGRMFGGVQGVAVTQSGALTQGLWQLAPGRYELYCSMPGHFALGMHVVVTVR